MVAEQIIFAIVTIITLASALIVVTDRNLFHAALAMMLSFLGVAGYYVLLQSGFMAASQLLVYIGAISILIIFAIMMTRRLMNANEKPFNKQWPWAIVGSLLLFGLMVLTISDLNELPTSVLGGTEQSTLFYDADQDGYLDSDDGEFILSEVAIGLVGSNGEVQMTGTSPDGHLASGSDSFTDLFTALPMTGTYTVTVQSVSPAVTLSTTLGANEQLPTDTQIGVLSPINLMREGAPRVSNEVLESQVVALGDLMTNSEGYVLPFELISVLLLAALVGSIVIARTEWEREDE